MDLKDKVTEALHQALTPELILLEDDDGISGYVVSKLFHGMPALERQDLIERAVRNSPSKLTKSDERHILAIAGISPAEYDVIGVPAHPAQGDR